jgi:glycosyltransferase involved in cell wall biosynthesis
MKVCFITGTLGRGGAEKQLVFMLRALQNAGIESRVLCLTKGESYEEEIKALGVVIEYVGGVGNQLRRLGTIIRNLRKQTPDIVQSSHFYTNIYAALAGKAVKIPSIGAVRSNLTSELKGHKFSGRFQISLPNFLIANSDFARRGLIERGIATEKVEFVRNVVEIALDESEISLKPKQNITFLFVGRLGREKRADRFVRLADALVKKFPAKTLRFQITGDGSLRKELEKQVQACSSLTGKFEFLGERREMSGIYRKADVLVLTSDYEGTPNVILEAMAHALPVIATRVGGTPEILTEECGILVEREDESSLMQAASDLIEAPQRRSQLGLKGFRYVKNNHSFDNLAGHLTKIYDRLLNRRENDLEIKQAAVQKLSRR